MLDYNKFYHLILRPDKTKWNTEPNTRIMLHAVLGWKRECYEAVASGLLKKRPQILVTAPLETVEYLAIKIVNWGMFGFKVTIKPVAGNSDGETRTWSRGPCCVSKLKTPGDCPPCDGPPVHFKTGFVRGRACKYWYCEAHTKWVNAKRTR
jgi:hypothetical protein